MSRKQVFQDISNLQVVLSQITNLTLVASEANREKVEDVFCGRYQLGPFQNYLQVKTLEFCAEFMKGYRLGSSFGKSDYTMFVEWANRKKKGLIEYSDLMLEVLQIRAPFVGMDLTEYGILEAKEIENELS